MLERLLSETLTFCLNSPVLTSHHFNSPNETASRFPGFSWIFLSCNSELALTSVPPSGENDTDHTGPSNPLITCKTLPVSVSHNSIRPDCLDVSLIPLAMASVPPSGEKLIERISVVL